MSDMIVELQTAKQEEWMKNIDIILNYILQSILVF
jgi:hypothetical protein